MSDDTPIVVDTGYVILHDKEDRLKVVVQRKPPKPTFNFAGGHFDKRKEFIPQLYDEITTETGLAPLVDPVWIGKLIIPGYLNEWKAARALEHGYPVDPSIPGDRKIKTDKSLMQLYYAPVDLATLQKHPKREVVVIDLSGKPHQNGLFMESKVRVRAVLSAWKRSVEENFPFPGEIRLDLSTGIARDGFGAIIYAS